jgi:hypothetical protein
LIFPFGRPIVRRRPSAKSKRRVYVLGAYPSALFIAWWSPARKGVRALPVDDEPATFWTGADEKAQIEAWRRIVHFRIGEWGEVETADEPNGKAGRWVDESVLAPLGVTRDETCLSYCLDTYRADPGAVFAVHERYQPFAREAGLPEAHVEPRPRDWALVELAMAEHRDRLLHELSVVVPELVVTLGNAALRVLRAVTEAKGGLGKLHSDDRYGVMQPLAIGKRNTLWLALTHHETPPTYVEAHARWRQRQGTWTATSQ